MVASASGNGSCFLWRLTVIALLLFMHWPSTFIPDEDDGYFIAVVQLPPAASLERTQAVGEKINAILDSYPEVKN